jgi:hypothetical protein
MIEDAKPPSPAPISPAGAELLIVLVSMAQRLAKLEDLLSAIVKVMGEQQDGQERMLAALVEFLGAAAAAREWPYAGSGQGRAH